MHKIISQHKSIRHIADNPVFTAIDNLITFEMGKEYWKLKWDFNWDTKHYNLSVLNTLADIIIFYNENNKVICCYVCENESGEERLYVTNNILDNIMMMSPYENISIVYGIIIRWIGRNLHIHCDSADLRRGRIGAGDTIQRILKDDKLKSETICEDCSTKQN